jgi:hypothetical protein
MSSKFEQLLDYLVNEEQEKANELFHEIVVEKSREIYENLIAEEEDEMDEASEQDDEAVDEASEEDEESMDEASEDDDESMDESTEEEAVESIFGEADDEEDSEFPVQDKTDDLEGDVEDPLAMGDEEGEEGGDEPATKDDIQDLEDALEELKAEFEALVAAEKNEEEGEPGVHGEPSPLDDLGGEEDEDDLEKETMMPMEASDEEEEEMKESKVAKSQGQQMREYIEKVAQTMTDGEGVGSGRGDLAGQTGHDSGKSPVSSGAGKPTSGANAKNIAQAEKGANEDGTSPKGKVGGLVKTGGDFVKAGTKNVASSANAKKPDGSKLTSVSKPGNKEGAPVGSGTGDKAGQTGAVDTNSPLNGAPNRAK